ncbi:hypothetical protein [Aeromicrobium sp. A1-2]|uniref:hypothetical protein n=1 Tax=Aeromicrobium sp. A1-2 TaxID=2107713 RepID=UPI0013C33DCF|nr:hypothetical protein [Aeromicrobium sp. A1-2]
MLETLTVVVTCTDRKAMKPSPELTVQSLTGSSMGERVGQWVDRIDSTPPRFRLRDLYRGDSWRQALSLEASALRTAQRVRVLVASAGLGLRDIDSSAAPYSATFSSGNVDTVGTDSTQLAEWWSGLQASTSALSIDAALDGPTLLVLSNAYARAMGPSLAALRSRDNVLTFGGHDAASIGPRIAADMTLRSALGGTAMTLNLRSAIKWVELCDREDIFSEQSQVRWQEWSRAASKLETYDRTPQSDNEIKGWIAKVIRNEPLISRTAALRTLRRAGLACEQNRFARLFALVGGAR